MRLEHAYGSKLISVFVYMNFLIAPLALSADESAILQAEAWASEYLLDAEFDYPERLSVIEFDASSSPESNFVFTSKGEMHKLLSTEGKIEGCAVRVQSLSEGKPGTLKIFGIPDEWETLEIDSKLFACKADTGKRMAPTLMDDEYRRFRFQGRGIRYVDVYDWPFSCYSLFSPNTRGANNAMGGNVAKMVFGPNNKCVEATWKDTKTVEGIWCSTRPGSAYHTCTFRDGLPVKHEIFVSVGVDGTKVPIKKERAFSYAKVETVWKKDGDKSVPNLIQATFAVEPRRNSPLISVIAKIAVFDKETAEFKKASQELAEMKKTIDK